MPYKVKSTERTNKKCADMETKALLYLMNFRSDSNEIFYFVIDFFNDVTGMTRYADKLWDVQSKAAKGNSPKVIGRELVTLFKNYLSGLDFSAYILFVGGVSNTFRIDDTKSIFNIENVRSDAIEKMKAGLVDEATNKEYIEDKTQITDLNVDEFLENVLFVIDDKDEKDYVREIIKNHPNIIPSDSTLNSIFEEIRGKQSTKKENQIVEDIIINTPDEVINFRRHLTNSEIRLLTLQRIINKNPLNNSIPISFMPIFNLVPAQFQRDQLEEIQQHLCRALFNNNLADEFWNLFATIYALLRNYPTDDVNAIFNRIPIDIRNGVTDLDVLSLKYFIAILKDGLS